MLVEDVMTAEPLTVSPETSVQDARTQLSYAGITAMPVVDGERRVCGVVSEADLIGSLLDDPRAHERPIEVRPLVRPRTVEDVYTRAPVTVHPRDDVTAAVQIMTLRGFKSLPVVDDRRRLVGIVSRSDVVRALSRGDDELAQDVRRVLTEMGHPEWGVATAAGAVEITGPSDTAQRSLAHTVVRTVPGVVEVRIAWSPSRDPGPSR